MKQILVIFFSILVIVETLGGTIILQFSVEPAGEKITLNWKTGEEINIDLFIIQRSTDNKSFISVGEVAPKGSQNSYKYVDSTLIKQRAIYYYRLQIQDKDGSFLLSESVSVIPNISSITKTWGSIKALFQ